MEVKHNTNSVTVFLTNQDYNRLLLFLKLSYVAINVRGDSVVKNIFMQFMEDLTRGSDNPFNPQTS